MFIILLGQIDTSGFRPLVGAAESYRGMHILTSVSRFNSQDLAREKPRGKIHILLGLGRQPLPPVDALKRLSHSNRSPSYVIGGEIVVSARPDEESWSRRVGG